MKKRMAMTVMALAVSAMAGSAFAADEPSKTTNGATQQNTIKAQLVTKPAISLEQMAKEQGIPVEELVAKLKKDGQIATDTITNTASFPTDKDGKTSPMMKVINLEDMAKKKGITVEELIAQLQKEGKLAPAIKLVPATPVQK